MSLVSLRPLNKETIIWNAGKRGWESKDDIVVAGKHWYLRKLLLSLGL